METFLDYFQNLHEIENFDSPAFIGDEKVSQDLCNFILALALVYNDSKNLNLIIQVLKGSKPEGKFTPTKEWGEYNGLTNYIFRNHLGLVHELFELINKNKKVLQTSYFQKILKYINKTDLQAWNDLASIALEASSKKSNPIRNTLFMIRNKVSFHYDLKELFKGYKIFFIEPGASQTPPLISRGNSMKGSRFYFSDAAAIEYLKQQLQGKNIEEFQLELEDILDKLNFSIYRIVQTFIQQRGFAWRRSIV